MNEKLNEAMNEVRDAYIEKAANPRKTRRLLWIPAVAAVLAVVLFVSSFSNYWVLGAAAISQADYDDYVKPDWESARLLAQQLQPFMEESIGQILGGADQENKAYSPINLYMALAVTAELSSGDPQLMELLDAQSLESLRQQANLVWNACYWEKDNQSLLANSVWLQKGLQFNKDLLDDLAENYFTSSYDANFGTDQTNAAIAAWVNQQTGNLLQAQTGNIDLSPDTVFALYATVFFRAKWQNEFSKLHNTQAVFHGATDTTCTFMNKKEMQGTYYWGEDYGAVALPLKDGSDMWLILPDEDKTVADVVASGEYLEHLWGENENYKYMKINLSLPKFDMICSDSLTEDVQALGITDIFDPFANSFAGFLEGPAWISAVNQATRVAIDEEGVTAASYIEILGAGAAPPPEEIIDFILDRPFLFVITNRYNLPLFAGIVNDMS